MAAEAPSRISVHITITIDPVHTEAFLTALKPSFEHVTAEPLNTFFEVYKDEKQPGVFKIVENWDASVEYMMGVQIKKDYYKPYHAAVQPMLLKPIEHQILSRMPGTEFASVRKEAYIQRN